MLHDAVLDGLAVARLTRLITTDTIFDVHRGRLQQWLVAENHDLISEGLLCDWCVAIWVAGAVTAAGVLWPRAWRAARGFLAAAQIAGSLLTHDA